jgi:DNA-binding MarR family transcriptional regulator
MQAERLQNREWPMPNDRADLDRFDLAILRVLQTEGRITSVELAPRIGLSKSPTQARMKRLEEAGSSPATGRSWTRSAWGWRMWPSWRCG